MAKKKNTIPSGFESILESFSNPDATEGVTNLDEIDTFTDPIEDDNNKPEPPVNKPEDGNQDHDGDDPNAHEDNSPEPPANNTEPPVN
jgi:hypothetical protein